MNKFTLTIFTAAALALTAYSRLRPPAEKTVYAAVTPVSRLAAKANRNPVTLQGHLISKLGPEKYLFRDPAALLPLSLKMKIGTGCISIAPIKCRFTANCAKPGSFLPPSIPLSFKNFRQNGSADSNTDNKCGQNKQHKSKSGQNKDFR